MAKPRQGDHIVYVVVDATGTDLVASFDLAEVQSALPENGKVEKRIVNVTEARTEVAKRLTAVEKLVLGVTKPAKKAKKETVEVEAEAPAPAVTPPLTESLNALADSLKTPEADAPATVPAVAA